LSSIEGENVIEYDISGHARDMMNERRIPEEWVKRTLRGPDYSEEKEDGTIHYIKTIPEHGGRFLRVIANPRDLRVVTLFFDRRLKRRQRSKDET
jgi:hypothetical protein